MGEFEWSDQWFVTDGVMARGPMPFDHLASDVARGRVQLTAFVRHAAWSIWQRFEQVGRLSTGARDELVRELAAISRSAEDRAADPASVPPPPLVAPERRETPPPASSGRPGAVNPVGVLARADTFDEALHLALSTAVTASRADAGLLHRRRRDLGVLVTAHAMGDRGEEQLGNRLSPTDPSVEAAHAGLTILAEAQPGSAGSHMAGRFVPLLGEVNGAAMIPLLAFGRLYGIIEVARASSSFYAREVARVEDVAEALTARAVVAGWVR
jgi:hypothetical protein